MTLLYLLKIIVGLGVLTSLGAGVSWGLGILNGRFEILNGRTLLDLNYTMLLLVVILSLAAPLVFRHSEIFHPIAKIWVASSARDFNAPLASRAAGILEIPRAHWRASVQPLILGAGAVSFLVLIFGILFVALNIFKLKRCLSDSLLYKKLDRVEIYFSSTVGIPFSFWIPGYRFVVLPQRLAVRPVEMKLAVYHELQHHRQGDTLWLYLMLALRIFCFWNPFVPLWMKRIHEFQEYACDEALVGRKGVSSKAYANCLVWVAETAGSFEFHPACAAGLNFRGDRHTLKRRIEKMFSQKPQRISKAVLTVMFLSSVALFAGAAAASQGWVQDRHVSMNDAQALAKKVLQTNDGFPVVVNDLVLKELNRYLGTPDGRDFMKLSLQRLENYRSLVDKRLQAYGVPSELLAIPIIESGYQDLQQVENESWGAGLWMFIKSTARNYGLRVDDTVDQRLNVDSETDAAMRLLVANHARFSDWTLSVLAYNAGESAVQQAMDKLGSRDPWTLVRNGLGNEPFYLPRLEAAILIMQNPNVLEQ